MATSLDSWLDQLISEGVEPPGPTNTKARDLLMDAARTSLIDATRDPGRSPGGIIRDTEGAVRQAIPETSDLPAWAQPYFPLQ